MGLGQRKPAGGSPARRASRALLAAAGLGALLAAVSSSAASAAVNWSTAKSEAAGGGQAALIKAAKKEGTLNVIALPSNWANYGVRDLDVLAPSTASRSTARLRATRALRRSRRSRPLAAAARPRTSSTSARRSRLRARAVSRRTRSRPGLDIPADPEGRQRRLVQRLRRIHLVRLRPERSCIPARRRGRRSRARSTSHDVALNGSPVSANAALSAVWAAALNNGGSLNNIKPGVSFFKHARESDRQLQQHRLQRRAS